MSDRTYDTAGAIYGEGRGGTREAGYPLTNAHYTANQGFWDEERAVTGMLCQASLSSNLIMVRYFFQ